MPDMAPHGKNTMKWPAPVQKLPAKQQQMRCPRFSTPLEEQPHPRRTPAEGTDHTCQVAPLVLGFRAGSRHPRGVRGGVGEVERTNQHPTNVMVLVASGPGQVCLSTLPHVEVVGRGDPPPVERNDKHQCTAAPRYPWGRGRAPGYECKGEAKQSRQDGGTKSAGHPPE